MSTSLQLTIVIEKLTKETIRQNIRVKSKDNQLLAFIFSEMLSHISDAVVAQLQLIGKDEFLEITFEKTTNVKSRAYHFDWYF